jgi:P pilus assembly chaperone PapD
LTENKPFRTKNGAFDPQRTYWGLPVMKSSICSVLAAALVAPLLATSSPAQAGIGDLLVAPTRIVLDGRRGTEIILNNIGDEPATYRISIEFRRMTEDGGLVEVAEPTAADKAAEDMIVYAPRRVTLAPHQPQSIRIAARAPQGLADGEYRVHMLFRAIPPATPVVPASASSGTPQGLRFQLIPVYGVTIPVIVRLGNLQATAAIANVRLDKAGDKPVVDLDLSRSGARSTFGDVKVLKAGVKNPIAIQKAVAVYTEIGVRHLSVPIDAAFQGDPRGAVTVQYVETFDDGSHVIAQTDAVLR